MAATRETGWRPKLLRLIRCNLQWHRPSVSFSLTRNFSSGVDGPSNAHVQLRLELGKVRMSHQSSYISVPSGNRGNRGHLLPKQLRPCFSANQHECTRCSGVPVDPRLLPGTEYSTESIIRQTARGFNWTLGLYRVAFSTAEPKRVERFLG